MSSMNPSQVIEKIIEHYQNALDTMPEEGYHNHCIDHVVNNGICFHIDIMYPGLDRANNPDYKWINNYVDRYLGLVSRYWCMTPQLHVTLLGYNATCREEIKKALQKRIDILKQELIKRKTI